jgi:hypothetical protein
LRFHFYYWNLVTRLLKEWYEKQLEYITGVRFRTPRNLLTVRSDEGHRQRAGAAAARNNGPLAARAARALNQRCCRCNIQALLHGAAFFHAAALAAAALLPKRLMSNSVFFQVGQCGNQLADSVWSSIRGRGLEAQCGAFADGKVASICVDLEPRVTCSRALLAPSNTRLILWCRCCAD